MISQKPSLEQLADFGAEFCVIGGGPVGIATALALSAGGRRVLLLESGGRTSASAAQALSAADWYSAATHHQPEITVARRLGGTSNLWGGRCVPFDPIDFRARPWLGLEAWPITEADLAAQEPAALEGLAAGEAAWREPLPGVKADAAFSVDTLERWSNVPRIQSLHGESLAGRRSLLVVLNTTVTGLELEGGRVSAVELHIEGRGTGRLACPTFVLAAGGNESTRLLLATQRRHPELFGGDEGPLGRYYMSHVVGRIADITLTNEALDRGFDFHKDGHGSYVRRRLVPSEATQAEDRLTNVAFWPVVPSISDPAHRSAPLSALFLALSIGPLGRRLVAEPILMRHLGAPPYERAAHLYNLALDPLRTLGFAPSFLWKTKAARTRLPGIFLRNPARRYGLEFHAEQLPRPDSRLTLGDTVDRLGMPRLRIDLRYSDDDASAVVRAHDSLQGWLERNRLGRLIWRSEPEERAESVLTQAKHGNHQIGTIRMGNDRRTAVVDGDCRSFDLANLYVISTAVLPTSSQANPTFTAVQLGLRMAAKLGNSALH